MKKKIKDFVRSTATRISPRFNTELMFLVLKKKRINLKNPQTFDEKISWLKLYDYPHRKITEIGADKYKVRDYVKEKGFEHMLIPLLGVYNHIDEIKLDELPDKFVLKWNNDSASVLICKDKNDPKLPEKLKQLQSKRNDKYYLLSGDYHGKNIKPLIVCEELIEPSNNQGLNDYKMYSFNGKVKYIMACVGRELGKPKFYFFDTDWNLQRINRDSKAAPENFYLEKPQKLQEAIHAAESLTQGIPFVRVDFYLFDDKVYFGELTFVPSGGVDPGLIPELDLKLGQEINLKGDNNA